MPLGTTLITGGAGNLARQLSADLAEAGHRVVLQWRPPAPLGGRRLWQRIYWDRIVLKNQGRASVPRDGEQRARWRRRGGEASWRAPALRGK